jgi:hypothetical protein
LDHIATKPRHQEAHSLECNPNAFVKGGEGERDDPSLKKNVDDIVGTVKPPHGNEWTKEDAEITGRRWHHEIVVQWLQGVHERQISGAEEKFIRKDGSLPIFVKESILPMWKAWKGVSFEAIQGLYEMPIQMQRTKMKPLRNNDQELYGQTKKLEKAQLEQKQKASRMARKTH